MNFVLEDNDVDEEHFEKALQKIVTEIELEMLTTGDENEDLNSLKNVEFKIQADQIVNVLEICIEKIEIAFCLPFIFEHGKEKLNEIYRSDDKEIKKLNEIITTLNNDSEGTIWVTVALVFNK